MKKYNTWRETYNFYYIVNPIQSLPFSEKIKVIEYFLETYTIHGMTNDVVNEILCPYMNAIFNMNEEADFINRLQILINQNPDPIRTCNELIFNYPTEEELENAWMMYPQENAETIWIHVLSAYNHLTKTIDPLISLNQMRILKPSENIGWRYPTCVEFLVYRRFVLKSVLINARNL
jgi:hypothetical protein